MMKEPPSSQIHSERQSPFLGVGLLILAHLLVSTPALAVITALTPLRVFLSDASHIVLVKVEKLDADMSTMILTVMEDLKGKPVYRKLPIKIEADAEAVKDKHIPQLLKRLAPDLPLILFVTDLDKRQNVLAFTNGTWFQIIGRKTGKDSIAWRLTHGEPFLRRTFKGTTEELKKIVVDSLSGKAKPPEANGKEEPGFGPEIEMKEISGIRGQESGIRGQESGIRGQESEVRGQGAGGILFAVIPTLGVGGPLALLALLFPTVFGGVLVLFRQWMAFITVLGINSTLFLLQYWLGPTYLRGEWAWYGTPAALWFAMTGVTALGVLWAWRRQLRSFELGADALETPQRTEILVLIFMSLTLGIYVGASLLIPPPPPLFDAVWNLTLVFAAGIWVATLVKLGRTILGRETLARTTEGVMLGVTLLGYVAFAAARWGYGSGGLGEVQAGDAATGDRVVEFVGERWRFQPKYNGVFVSSALVHGDRLYVAYARPSPLNRGGALFCLDRNTGEEVWTFDDDDEFKQAFSSPTFADGRLYIGEGWHDDANCKLYCLDAATGRKIWDYQTTSQTESSPSVFAGRVYLGAGNEGLICLDAFTKEKLWQYPPEGHKGRLLRVGAGPAVAYTPEGGQRVFCGSAVDRNRKEDPGETAVFCLSANSGREVWKVATDLPCWGGAVYSEGQVFFALGNGDIFNDAPKPAGAILCLDPKDGNKKWQCDVPNGIIDKPAVDRQHIYFGCRDMYVYCLSRADGSVKWKRFMDSPVAAGVALAGSEAHTDSVIVVATDGLVRSLDAATGDIQWSFSLTQSRAVLVATPRVAIARTSEGERRQIYFGAGLGANVLAGDIGNGPAVVYCLEDRVKKVEAKSE